MVIKINRFFFDGRDLFIVLFGTGLILYAALQLTLLPAVQNKSLLMLFIFLVTMRTLATQKKLSDYILIVSVGMLLSFVLSPLGMICYLLTAVIIHSKLMR